jgi:exonuclease SbcD
MKLLHTSDWHLGRMLYSKKERYDEHKQFLHWLLDVIKTNAVDVLLVAGDVFDTVSPGSGSQKMYYDFLLQVRNCGCRNVIITGGNHDSPSLLNAPKEILAAINVHVVGNASENIEDEIIVVKDDRENPVVIVCAVPFLRERDISRFSEGETYSDRSKRIAESIKNHYSAVAEIAENMRKKLGNNIPLVATGHLSVAGGKQTADDGVRETYIGSIECVGSDIFPATFDYVALGHYHIPSLISETVRYSGSPIPMGFGEAEQQKSVYIIDFNENKPTIKTLEIPVFQKLESIRGDKLFIENRLTELKNADDSVWVEIIYNGSEVFSDFSAWAKEKTVNTKIEILKLQNLQYLNKVLTQDDNVQSLDELNECEIFDKFLEKCEISDEQKAELKICYNEIVMGLNVEK